MNEEVIQFGCESHLVGVVTTPEKRRLKKPVAVILLNAGIVHHAGPYRLNVVLARAFAETGFTVLRMDLPGIGDSEWPPSAANYEHQVVNDIQSAMDRIQADFAIGQFVLMGICTGADNAHRTALVDPRVVGAVFMDGYTYPTLKYLVRRALPVFLSPARLGRAFRYHLWEKHWAAPSPEPNAQDEFNWTAPSREAMAADLQQFASRDLRLLYIYTHSWSDYYNYPEQLADAFPNVDFANIQLEYWPQVDHTYSKAQYRAQLTAFLSRWADANFSASSTARLSHRESTEADSAFDSGIPEPIPEPKYR